MSEVFIDVWRQADRFEAPLAGFHVAAWRSPATRRSRRCAAARPKSSTRKSRSSSKTRPTVRRPRCRSKQRSVDPAGLPRRSCRRRIARSSTSSTTTRSRSTRWPRSSACRPEHREDAHVLCAQADRRADGREGPRPRRDVSTYPWPVLVPGAATESGEVLSPRESQEAGPLMLCETCRWTERPGFVRASAARHHGPYPLITR